MLDASRKDGTTVPFTPYTSDEYCIYNKETGAVKRKDDSLRLCTISGADDGSFTFGSKAVMKIVLQIFADKRLEIWQCRLPE